MPQPFFSKQKPGPVKHGNGGGDDLAAQARHFTVDALGVLEAQLKNSELDAKQRFAVARYILELGWGRPRAMREAEAATGNTVITGVIETRLLAFLEKTDFGHDPDPDGGGEAAVDPAAGPGGMGSDGPDGAADA